MANLLKFAYVGDTHGHIENMPRFIYEYQQLKKTHPDIISVFTGDFIGTSLESIHSKGKLDLFLHHKIYDEHAIMTLGNHDFDFGEEQLSILLQKLKSQVVVSNIRFTHSRSPLQHIIKRHYQLAINHSLIVFLGLLPYEMTVTSDQLKTISVLSYEESLKALREEMALFSHIASPVGFVILSHLGIDLDKALAEEIPNSLIFGGHSHTVLPLYLSTNKETAVAHAGSNAQYIGLMNAKLAKKGFVAFSEDFLQVKADTPNDLEALKKIDEWTSIIYTHSGINLKEEIITINLHRRLSGLEWNKDMDSHQGHARYNDTFITRTICDAMQDAIQRESHEPVDFALFHGGGVRAGLPQAVITYRDIFNVFPYPQYLVTLHLTGKELIDELEIGVGMTNWHQRSGLLHPSSCLYYCYDGRKPRGSRIQKVLFAGKLIDLKKKYKIVTNSWIGSGKEGHVFFGKYWQQNAVQHFPQCQQAQIFLNYLRNNAQEKLQQEFATGQELFGLRIDALPSLDASETIAKDPRFARGKESIFNDNIV